MAFMQPGDSARKGSGPPVFVVGCPRAGTTLVQSLIASGGEIASFPETNTLFTVLDDITYRRFGTLKGYAKLPKMFVYRPLNALGLTKNFKWAKHDRDLPASFQSFVSERNGGRRFSVERVFREFEHGMTLASRGGRWMDKSPENIFALDYIEQYFPEALIVHVLREPKANMASLIDAAAKHVNFAKRFGGPKGLRCALACYNKAAEISLSRKNNPRHMLLSYERLSDDTPRYLRGMETFLGLGDDSLKPVYDVKNISLPEEVWKRGAREVKRRKSKALDLFDASELAYINDNALNPELCLGQSDEAAWRGA